MTDMTSLHISPGKLKLLLAAERQIGEVGIEAASLRQIAQDAGYRNVRAVQYHFNTKDSIVSSVLQMRRAEMDAKRITMFADSGRSLEDTSSSDLIRYLILPPFQQIDDHGIRSFARFYRAVIPFIYQLDDRNNLMMTANFASRVLDVLRSRSAEMPDEMWVLRTRALSLVNFNFIANYDLGVVGGDLDDQVFLRQLIVMSRALLEAHDCSPARAIPIS